MRYSNMKIGLRSEMSHSLRKNFFYNSAYQILLMITPLITTPWLSRTIGSSGNGVFAYTQAIVNYFVMFSTLGLSNYGVRIIAECDGDRKKRSRVFWEVITMSAGIGLLVLIAYILFVIAFGRRYTQYWILWGFWVIGSILDTSWLFFGLQEFKMPTIRNFITKLISVVMILLLVRDSNDVWAYILAIAASYLLNSLLLWPFIPKYVDFIRPTLKGIFSHIKPNLTLFIPVIATSLYTLLDRVMLGAMSGMGQAGYYDYAEKISKLPMAVITALGAVVLPKMTAVISAGHTIEGKHLVQKTMWFMLFCAYGLAFGIASIAPEFVPIFFGEGFESCIPLMRILSLVIPLICITNVIGVQYLLPTHQDNAYTLSVVFGAITNIIINIFAIPHFGAMGAAFATVLAEFIVLLAQVRVTRHDLKITSSILGTIPFAVFGLLMFAIVRLISTIINSTLTSLFIEIAAGASFYLVLSLVWCELTKNSEFSEIFPRLVKWKD